MRHLLSWLSQLHFWKHNSCSDQTAVESENSVLDGISTKTVFHTFVYDEVLVRLIPHLDTGSRSHNIRPLDNHLSGLSISFSSLTLS